MRMNQTDDERRIRAFSKMLSAQAIAALLPDLPPKPVGDIREDYPMKAVEAVRLAEAGQRAFGAHQGDHATRA